jgi:hypothetical protein
MATEKKRLSNARYRERNRDKLRERMVHHAAKYRAKHAEKIAIYEKSEHAKEVRRLWMEKNQERLAEARRRRTREWASKEPQKRKVHQIFRRLLAKGLISKPSACSNCGKPERRSRNGASLLHGHHRDYSKPEQVVWLCVNCHLEEHRKAKA